MSPARLLVPLLAGLAAALPARAAGPDWPDTYLSRVEATAVMQSLNAALLASRSATTTLEGWCATHQMAEVPRLAALVDRTLDRPASPETRKRLAVGPEEPLRYRRLRLACGDHVLSEADNWYVPSRLTPEMNRLLETTETPFGRAVSSLGITRQTVGAEPHWQPLPEGWDQAAPPAPACGTLGVPEHLFSHRAVVSTAERQPISEVVETYTREVLNFTRAPRPADPACPKL
jgi:chorismate-pyruvate lyase